MYKTYDLWGTNNKTERRYEVNVQDWNVEAKKDWSGRSDVEVERYFFNLKTYIARKKKERPKPSCLIKNRKEWREGLKEILINRDPTWLKKYSKTLPSKGWSVSSSVQTAQTQVSSPSETTVSSTTINSLKKNGKGEDSSETPQAVQVQPTNRPMEASSPLKVPAKKRTRPWSPPSWKVQKRQNQGSLDCDEELSAEDEGED